ncbi:hypothetical protein B0T24DRAFT_596540 [Lasiosphaeria ovina]|uniref:Amidase domain-containing protein n=1 Tax=Lasiosphaeria ovina TaxID=92902 RepID=A0AAE0JYD2_9PEZI|nr:hypothetical protein B0T24DRAFT_596540 [Lasiosphaeria ovina]
MAARTASSGENDDAAPPAPEPAPEPAAPNADLYVRGGVDPTDTWLGLSTSGGSSSGSAASVAAGMAPVALRTETDGSILVLSERASLYLLKLTPGKASTRGTLGYTLFTDTLGPIRNYLRMWQYCWT